MEQQLAELQTSRRPQQDESQTNTAAPATQHNLVHEHLFLYFSPHHASPIKYSYLKLPAEVLEAVTSHLTAKKIVLPPLDWITSNDINGEVFQTLTTENLPNLGVSSLGGCTHILKLQQATAPVSGTAVREMLTVPCPPPFLRSVGLIDKTTFPRTIGPLEWLSRPMPVVEHLRQWLSLRGGLGSNRNIMPPSKPLSRRSNSQDW